MIGYLLLLGGHFATIHLNNGEIINITPSMEIDYMITNDNITLLTIISDTTNIKVPIQNITYWENLRGTEY